MAGEPEIARGVSRGAINAFFKRNAISGDVHSLVVSDHGRTVVRLAPYPYRPEDKSEVYSLSKTFSATAVGMLVYKGLVNEENLICDLFPDKVPAEPSENLKKMKLRHVLSMNSGHENCVMGKMNLSADPVRTFMEEEVRFEPGTHFTYDTGCSALLACLVKKITGMNVSEYLSAELFPALGIRSVSWLNMSSGINMGGCGIHVSADDIAKFGRLFLSGGEINGVRYISEEWIKKASSFISDTKDARSQRDWINGYGYQMWLNRDEGYRGDGAFGQLMMIYPERDIVVAVTGMFGDMQGEVESVYDLVTGLYDDGSEELVLPEYHPIGSETRLSGLEGAYYSLDENPYGFKGLTISYDNRSDCLTVTLSDGSVANDITAGNGKWFRSTIFAKKWEPNLPEVMSSDSIHRSDMCASYSADEGKIQLLIRHISCPHQKTWCITGNGDEIEMKAENCEFLEPGCGIITGHRR